MIGGSHGLRRSLKSGRSGPVIILGWAVQFQPAQVKIIEMILNFNFGYTFCMCIIKLKINGMFRYIFCFLFLK